MPSWSSSTGVSGYPTRSSTSRPGSCRRSHPRSAWPRGVRTVADALSVVRTDADALPGAVVAACKAALAGEGSVALIAADEQVAQLHDALAAAGLGPALLGAAEDAMEQARLVCVPATLAKGLEFDAVVVAEPARIVAAEPRGLQRLYVVLTRAVSRLRIVHAAPLPAALGIDRTGERVLSSPTS